MNLLPAITKNELDDLRHEGIQPTDKEIAWLVNLGRVVENPSGRVDYALAGSPVQCGNVTLWPLSIASGMWFDTIACRLFKTEAMQLYCLAFAMAHARDASVAWDQLNDYSTARRTVNRWAMTLRCTVQELRAAVTRILPQLDAPHTVHRAEDQNRPRPTSLLSDLVAGTGLPREYWCRQPWSFAEECLWSIRQQWEHGGNADGYEDLLYRDAMNEFMLAAKAVRDAHNGQ